MRLKSYRRHLFRTWLAALAACLFVAACAQAPKSGPAYQAAGQNLPPLIQLAPASLGTRISEQQRLTLVGPSGQRTILDALLEVDAKSVRLAFVQMGQVVARLEWDGTRLEATQVRQWPNEVSAERILSDLQFARWPLVVVQDALSPPWSLVQKENTRRLRLHEEDVVLLTTGAEGQTQIHYLQSGWRLTIQTYATNADTGNVP